LNPQLPSAAGLIDSFLKDLQGIASLFSQQQSTEHEFTILFFKAAGGTSTWTADRDCTLVGVMPVGGSNSIALTIDGTTYTQNFAAGGDGKRGNVLFIGGTSTQQIRYPMRIPLALGSKLTFSNNSASNGSMLIWLA
jgi:hypothetical protein